MKKKILVLILLFQGNYLFGETILEENKTELDQLSHEDEILEDNDQDCFDFFAVSDTEIELLETQPKKEVWSYTRVLAVRLGVATALALQSCYIKIKSAYSCICSWISR